MIRVLERLRSWFGGTDNSSDGNPKDNGDDTDEQKKVDAIESFHRATHAHERAQEMQRQQDLYAKRILESMRDTSIRKK